MEETYLFNVEGVKKKILHGGYGELPDFQEGSKITFHFQTLKDDFERTVLDDSREAGIPMEIIVGKMFKIEVWETLLTSMRIGEVAEFWCDPVHTGMYALVSKSMRKIAEGKDPLEGQKHRCGMGNLFDYHSTGYTDLDELQRTPQPLIFIMELFKVEDPSAYKRDTWAMNTEEKLVAVPKLHTEGNRLVLSRKFKEAAEKYQEAVICLRNIQAKEKPWEEEWLHLEELVNPLVLNYCQCQLELGEYYEVLEHTTDLLQKDNENVKAYFKRAKAHAAVWNEEAARRDFMRVTQLDPSLAAAVRKELKLLGEKMRRKHVEERKRYQGIFDYPVAKGRTEGQAGEEAKGLSKEQEEVPHNRLKAQVEESGSEALEESRPEALKPERGAEWPGVDETDGETEQGKRDRAGPGRLIRKEGEMDKEDSFPQKGQQERATETGDEEQGRQAQQKYHSSSGEESVSCETSVPDQELWFGEWEPKEEQEKANEAVALGTQEQNGALGFATVKEEQGKLIQEDSEEEMEGAAGRLLASTEDLLSREGCEAERCFLGTEREEDEARECGNGETPAGGYSRPQEETGWAEDFKEWAREESSEEIFEEDFFQAPPPQEEPERGERVTKELSPREESSPEWWDCSGLREEASISGKEEHREEVDWEGKETETDDRSRPVREIHGYENGCCTEYHKAETDLKETVTEAENCREGIQEESPKIEFGGEFSWAQRDERQEEIARRVQEKTKVECSSGAREGRWEGSVQEKTKVECSSRAWEERWEGSVQEKTKVECSSGAREGRWEGSVQEKTKVECSSRAREERWEGSVQEKTKVECSSGAWEERWEGSVQEKTKVECSSGAWEEMWEGSVQEKTKVECSSGAREERWEGSVQEKTKVECSSRAWEERWEGRVGLEGLEDEMCFQTDKFKVGMGEENSDRDQGKEDFHWEWPEDTGVITHLSLEEEPLSPWSGGDTPKDEGGDPHITRNKDTSQACCAMKVAEPGVKSVPNVWATKQPGPVKEEAQGNRE
ncbi:UNVERIFIED_CONTAM: hypothetical protein K2H54_042893 [Gekko kuhli]